MNLVRGLYAAVQYRMCTNRLKLRGNYLPKTFREIIAVQCNNHMKDIHRGCGQNTEISFVTAGELCLYHKALH